MNKSYLKGPFLELAVDFVYFKAYNGTPFFKYNLKSRRIKLYFSCTMDMVTVLLCRIRLGDYSKTIEYNNFSFHHLSH